MTRMALAVGLTVGLAGPAGAADFDPAKIGRTIVKEPAYTSKAPRYCLLVFGPEDKTRVWLVLDGDTMYMDRNGDGDLTGAGEKVAVPAFVPNDSPLFESSREVALGEVKDGELTHTGLKFEELRHRTKLKLGKLTGEREHAMAAELQSQLDKTHRQVPDGRTAFLSVDMRTAGREGTVNWFAWVDDAGQLTFGHSPATAPVVHFGGPLTLLSNPNNKIRHNPGPDDTFTVHVGTAGHGAGTFAYMTYDRVPQGVHPVVEAEFPAAKAGDPPVRERYELKERC